MSSFEYEVIVRLDRLQRRLYAVERHLGTMDKTAAEEFNYIAQAVANVQGTEASTAALLTELSAFIQNHADDPKVIMQVKEILDANRDQLVAAVEANKLPPNGT